MTTSTTTIVTNPRYHKLGPASRVEHVSHGRWTATRSYESLDPLPHEPRHRGNEHLGVLAGLVICLFFIEGFRDNFAISNDEGSHRDVSVGYSHFCELKSSFHPNLSHLTLRAMNLPCGTGIVNQGRFCYSLGL